MATTLSLAPLFRHSVGFDLFESALRSEAGTSYPPHNVEKHGYDHYRIVIAVLSCGHHSVAHHGLHSVA